MPDPKEPIAEPSLINEPKVVPPVEPLPEAKLFPDKEAEAAKAAEAAKVAEAAKAADTAKAAEEAAKAGKPKEGEPKPGDAKPSPEQNATVDYENLKLPEGSLLSADELSAVKKEAKDNKLTLDEAQGILDIKNDTINAYNARQKQALSSFRKEWRSSWEKDPDFGGDKLSESTENAKRAWDKLADNELKTLADQTGWGDHPAVLRMLARAGALFSEDQLVRGTLGGPPKEIPPEERMYPTSKEVAEK